MYDYWSGIDGLIRFLDLILIKTQSKLNKSKIFAKDT